MTTLYRAGALHDDVTSWSSSREHAEEYLPSGFYGNRFGGAEWQEMEVPDDAKVLDLRADLRGGLASAGINIGTFQTVPNELHDRIREQIPALRACGYEFVAFVDGGADQDEWLDLRLHGSGSRAEA